jgi:outer membrane protein assembly factor BamB
MAGAGFTGAGGTATNGRVLAFKVVESDGRPSLQPAWASRDLTSPVAPLVMNGVVFVLSTGEFRGAGTAAERRTRSSPAVLYAIDGTTGTELWNSGTTITSFVHEVPPSGSDSQIYVATADGTLYTFGMPTER